MMVAVANLHVLCVDNEPDNLSVLTYTLKYYHVTYKAVQSGEEALQLLISESFDIALLDIQMPKMSGWELVRRIRESEIASVREMLLIALTAHAMKGDREKTLKAGFDGYISKPIDPSTFLETLRAIQIDRQLSRNIDVEGARDAATNADSPAGR